MRNNMEKAKEAIDQVFDDTSVSKDTTRKCLKELMEHIEILLESLE